MKDDSKKYKDIPYFWIDGSSIFKWPYYPKQSTD